MRLYYVYSRYTKNVAFPTGTEPVSFHTVRLPTGSGSEKKSTTIYLGVVANKNKDKGEEVSEKNERSEQRETEVQAVSPESTP